MEGWEEGWGWGGVLKRSIVVCGGWNKCKITAFCLRALPTGAISSDYQTIDLVIKTRARHAVLLQVRVMQTFRSAAYCKIPLLERVKAFIQTQV